MDVSNFLPTRHTQEEVNPEKPGDWIDDEGMLRCGKCGKRKQYRISCPAIPQLDGKIVPAACDCVLAMEKERMEQEAYRETMQQTQRLRSASMMASKFRDNTFKTFKVTKENQKIFIYAQKYVEKFRDMEAKQQGLLLYGSVGTGKSFTAACIANALLDRQVSVVMTSFVKILEDIQGSEDESRYMTVLNAPRLLIIDDLGAERNTDYAQEKVYNVIDSRIRSGKPMILTTNLTLDQMMESQDIRYQRIYDRIFEVCYPLEMSWRSFRRAEAAQRFNEMKKMMEE